MSGFDSARLTRTRQTFFQPPGSADQLAHDIPHYLPRHVVKPGMTGWAQVNGLRGAGDLAARVRHDIYYIENWSLWLDVQIVLLTFVRWRSSAY